LKGCSYSLFKILFQHFAGGAKKNHEKISVGYLVFAVRFKYGASHIQSRSANHSTIQWITSNMLHFNNNFFICLSNMNSASHYLPISSTGMMTPVSLLANIILTRQVVCLISDITSCGTTQPIGDTGTTLTSEQEKKRLHRYIC
jgi:hypothetical protein